MGLCRVNQSLREYLHEFMCAGRTPAVPFVTPELLQEQGYASVPFNEFFLLSEERQYEVFQWCSEQFGQQHWEHMRDVFWFTRSNDALLFKIKWL